MSTWLINDVSPESLGLTVVGGIFRSGSASSLRLRAARDFDAAEILSGYGGGVTIKRNGTAFFKGTIRAIPKSASGEDEGQDYLVEDAWADLERTTYQENWGTGAGAVLMPRCYLGVNAAGTRITLGEQIEEAINFAVSAGVSLQLGSVPDGMLLWPTEADGVSCAEVIRTSLRHHADWIPWIDHTTTPPTFNVTPRATATALSIAATACESLDVVEMQDRLPGVVRICFVFTNEVDGVASRSVTVQKWPSAGVDSGPGVLSTTVDLEGVRATYQKQQVKTRTLPTDATTCRAWLIKKFPSLSGVPEGAFVIEDFAAAIAADPDPNPDPIDTDAPRQIPATLGDVPRELVEGSIHEWMNKKVGQVRLSYTIKEGEDLDLWLTHYRAISRVPQGCIVNGTDAITKLYKSLASYSGSENLPAGIAQAYYEAIHAGCRYEGSITLRSDDLTPPWHGRKLNLTGGVAGWATMGAPIHGVSWDAQTERITIDFGPTPAYSVQDFLEYLKQLRRRPATWITAAERAASEPNQSTSQVIGGAVLPIERHEHGSGNDKHSALYLYDAGDDPDSETDPDLEWSFGLETAGSTDRETPNDVNIELPVVVDTTDAGADPPVTAQVTVEKDATKRIYTVSGNGKEGSLTYTPDSSTAVTVIEWKDGLITTGSTPAEAVDIPIPAPPPDGTTDSDLLRWDTTTTAWVVQTGATAAGDILYWDGTSYQWLAAGTAGEYLEAGTAPSWSTPPDTGGGADNLSELDDVSVGTPATGQILYFNGTDWVGLTAPAASGTVVLGAVDGALQWLTTDECS